MSEDVTMTTEAGRIPTRPAGTSFPLPLLTLAIVVAGYAALFLGSVATQSPVRLLDQVTLGLDFRDFRAAAVDVLAGVDPYLRARFVTPPLSWIPFVPFAPIPLGAATTAFLCANAVALVAGVTTLVRHHRLDATAGAIVAMACALSPSTTMLLDRGNVDGLVFALTCLGLAWSGSGVGGPVALAAATCVKLYPGVFLPALAVHGRIRAAAVAAACVAASAALMPGSLWSFVHGQVVRAGHMRLDENMSGLAPFWLLDRNLGFGDAPGFPTHPFTVLAAVGYVAALCTCLWCDARLRTRVAAPDAELLLATYAAFCVNMPSLVYLYSGVCLFILLAALARPDLASPPARLQGMAVALGMAMFPARSIELTVGGKWAWDLNLVPAVGSLLLVVEVAWLRLDLLRAHAPDPAPPRPDSRRVAETVRG